MDKHYAIHISCGILNKEFACKLLIFKNSPGRGLLVCNIFSIVENTCCTPHITYRIVVGIFAVALYKAKVLFYVWRDILIYIVWRLSKIPVYREQKVLCQHPLNNVVGWTDKVKVLVPLLNFGEGCLINIKCLVDYGDLLAGLLLVPLFKLRENALVYVISPVVNL